MAAVTHQQGTAAAPEASTAAGGTAYDDQVTAFGLVQNSRWSVVMQARANVWDVNKRRNERYREQELAPDTSYLDQPEPSNEHITPQMRMIVCSWLSEVACEFNMQQETLFLAVTLMDRFMSDTQVRCSSNRPATNSSTACSEGSLDPGLRLTAAPC